MVSAAFQSEKFLIRCAAQSERISVPGMPHSFSVYDSKNALYRRCPKRAVTHSSKVSASRRRCRCAHRYESAHRPDSQRPEATDDVLRRQRVREVLPVVVDARQAGSREELVSGEALPDALDLLQLREEAMAAEVEAVAVELDGLRDPADRPVGLEHDRGPPAKAERVRGGQPGRPSAEDGVPDMATVRAWPVHL